MSVQYQIRAANTLPRGTAPSSHSPHLLTAPSSRSIPRSRSVLFHRIYQGQLRRQAAPFSPPSAFGVRAAAKDLCSDSLLKRFRRSRRVPFPAVLAATSSWADLTLSLPSWISGPEYDMMESRPPRQMYPDFPSCAV